MIIKAAEKDPRVGGFLPLVGARHRWCRNPGPRDTSEGPKRIQNSARGETTSVSTLGVARQEFYPDNESKAFVHKKVFRALL